MDAVVFVDLLLNAGFATVVLENLCDFWGLRIVEGSRAPAINGVDFTTLLKQENKSFHVTAEGGKVQRRASVVVPEIQINILAGKTQQGLTATIRER